MKSIIIVCFIVTSLLTSCRNETRPLAMSEEELQFSLVGKWRQGIQNETQDGYVGHTIYNDDGTLFAEYRIFENGEFVGEQTTEGNWEVRGNLLTMTVRSMTDREDWGDEYTVISELLEISHDRYVWRGEDCILQFQTRVKE